MRPPFLFTRRVQYHETDAMAVVHHSNHVRYFEEARVAWLRDRGHMSVHEPYGELVFAVLAQSARYVRSLRFDDEMTIVVESQLRGARIFFQYAIFLPDAGPDVGDLFASGPGQLVASGSGPLVASGSTELVPLTKDFRPSKLPDEVRAAYRDEPWSNAWPPSTFATRS